MSLIKFQLVPTLVLLAGVVVLPAQAGSLVTSSAAGGSSASSATSSAAGSASDSSKGSSDSSSKTNRVADGPYKVIEVATMAERPGMVRLRLQAVADAGPAGEFLLDLPQPAFEQARLAAGQTVTARQRPYGTEFAQLETDKAFFLLLDDDWARWLPSNPVRL